MNAADLLPALTGCAAGVTVCACIITANAWRLFRETQRRNARLIRQSAEIEAERERNKRTTEAIRALLRQQPLFNGARRFENI